MFNNFEELLKDIRDHLDEHCEVEQSDDPMKLIIGYKCSCGKSWGIKLRYLRETNKLLRTALQTIDGKAELLKSLNGNEKEEKDGR